MNRRAFLATGAGTVSAGLAGCAAERTDDGAGVGSDDGGGSGSDDGSAGGDGTSTEGETVGETDDTPTLTVATYDTLVDAPTTSPGEWIKERFEATHDAELEWAVPDGEVNHYIQRRQAGLDVEPEVYLGVKPSDLYRVDAETDGDLFRATDRSALANVDDVREAFEFDPDGRVIPTYQNYCAVVYDGRTVPEPTSFADLLDPVYEGEIGIPNPLEGDTGEMFLLWTIAEHGPDGYLDYWNDLLENAVVLSSWSEMYPQFEANELNVVVSYSNDRVYAERFGNDLEKHRVAFLDGGGYANLNGMARFADGDDDELAHAFMDFVLADDTQRAIAELNVTGPVTGVEPPAVYREFAEEPADIVHFDYPTLRENRADWLDAWEREVAGGR
ncbi:extracellular solute-binding protein [Halorubrum sp. JWXQ-INN 858]|uniref:thiamine ABC transporter substrate-binding protein n=1 Tax=Halorubrum sp. JWXQ-INN 858 TaxID=2690782 RepID=UPI00135C2470|nr:extracellular solute-binding protein [Halorubrum sp. JWXQ-INN 858]MWV65331.1 extracellular solute-binding protein [Halorubrum sp. JWXQ-INN 858]